MTLLLEVQHLVKHFPIGGGFFGGGKKWVHAVNGVSFQVTKGETLGIVGESGCGKTTLGLLLLKLLESDQGKILFDGTDLVPLSQKTLRPLRSKMQMVFQDPYASLNPRMSAGDIIEEPLIIHKMGNRKERRLRVEELLGLVGLKETDTEKYPHEFSGGQRQRVGIARAIALHPELLIADEPVSALDVSIQGEILNLLRDIQKKFHLTMIFISHDLKVISQISDQVVVMYLGKIVERLPADRLHLARHPYTQALLKAVPLPDPSLKKNAEPLRGDVPSPILLPSGCHFHPRCPYQEEICVHQEPLLTPQSATGGMASCHLIHKVPKEIPI